MFFRPRGAFKPPSAQQRDGYSTIRQELDSAPPGERGQKLLDQCLYFLKHLAEDGPEAEASLWRGLDGYLHVAAEDPGKYLRGLPMLRPKGLPYPNSRLVPDRQPPDPIHCSKDETMQLERMFWASVNLEGDLARQHTTVAREERRDAAVNTSRAYLNALAAQPQDRTPAADGWAVEASGLWVLARCGLVSARLLAPPAKAPDVGRKGAPSPADINPTDVHERPSDGPGGGSLGF